MTKWDPDLFHNLVLPDGIDKDLFLNTLLIKGGEFEVLFPDPAFMRMSIGVWGNKWYRTFAEWLRGTQATWNPIHNYDKFEEAADQSFKGYGSKVSADYNNDRTADLTDERTADLTDEVSPGTTETTTYNDVKDEQSYNNYKETETYNSVKDEQSFGNYKETKTYNNVKDEHDQTVSATNQHDVSAFDSATLTTAHKDTINAGTTSDTRSGSEDLAKEGTAANTKTGNQTHEIAGTAANTKSGNQTVVMTGSDTTTHSGTDTTTHSGTDKINISGTLSETHGGEAAATNHGAHIYGNIGVTQASDMLRSFYDISAWSLYDHMADVFTREMLIPVYD